jgi:PAS domain-containing protein/CheY-like chemotaxis protein
MTPKRYALIVEPDLRLLHLLVQAVSAHKLEPVPARDGVLAKAVLAERGAPTILITDLNLPRLDGFALLAELRHIADASLSAAMVISSSMEMRAKAYDSREALGISEIVSSTLSPGSMASAIQRALDGMESAAPTEHRLPVPPMPASPHPTLPAPPLRKKPAAPKRTLLSLQLVDAQPGARAERAIEPEADAHAEPGFEPMTEVLPRFRDPQRLARIANLGLVDDGPPAASLQRLVEETARTFGVPIALLSLVLEDRQWFKAHVGLGGELLQSRGTPIAQSFCRHVVDADTIGPLIVPDATRHPVFADNPLVLSGAVGSYAGAPLLTAHGDVLGTLCIIDTKPLGIDQEQVEILVALARRVAGEIELQTRAHASAALNADLARKLENEQSRSRSIAATVASYGAVLNNLEIGILLMDEERQILYANPALAEMMELEQADLISLSGQELREHIASLSDDPAALALQMHALSEGPFVAREELVLSRPMQRLIRWESKPVHLSSGRAQLEVYTELLGRAE